MEGKKLDFCVIFVVLSALSSCARCYDFNFDIQARQQIPTQRPIGPGGSNVGVGNPNLGVSSQNRPSGPLVVEIQTPPTPPSNVVSTIVARPSVVPIIPIVPIIPQRPNMNSTITVRPTVRPGTSLPGAVNIMATKSGLYPVPNDPCSYVSCIRADSFLQCGHVKCDPGTAFSQPSARCIPSNQCLLRPK